VVQQAAQQIRSLQRIWIVCNKSGEQSHNTMQLACKDVLPLTVRLDYRRSK